jgi:hypothetical protein
MKTAHEHLYLGNPRDCLRSCTRDVMYPVAIVAMANAAARILVNSIYTDIHP